MGEGKKKDGGWMITHSALQANRYDGVLLLLMF